MTSFSDVESLKTRFDISEEFGFAAEYPLSELPEYFKPWTDIAHQLKQLIDEKKLRDEVHKLPLLDHNKLKSKAEWEAAHLFLAYISQGYVWQDGEEGIPEILPKCLAVPFHATSQHLQIPASYNQFNSVLVNWRLRDPQKPFQLENLTTNVTLMGGEDEVWFFMTSLAVEKACAPALYAIVDAQEAVYHKNDSQLEASLKKMESSILMMVKQLKRIGDGLRPHIFYNVIRPFIAGWNAPAFQEKGLKGLIYEGVRDEPFSFSGGTAADSSTLPALDAALGISHQKTEDELLDDFKKYMPPKHVEFIAAVGKGPSIRDYVLNKRDSEVLAAYNRCLEAVQSFRNTHLQIVTRFIVVPASKSSKGQGKGLVGTGGTGFMQFLKGLRDSTIEALIGKEDPKGESNPQCGSPLSRYATIATVAAISVVTCATIWRYLR
ncbi:indoleamine 2,3-dioxygenase 2-like isoform X2 [Apostichopus japonicus]